MTKEEIILEAIRKLDEKVDNIASQVKAANDSRLDSETVAILTAAAYNTFGQPVAVRSIKLTNDGNNKSNRYGRLNVVAQNRL